MPRPPKEPPECPTCNGSGTVTKWTTDRNGKRISYETTCDRCNGTGQSY